MIRVRSRRSQVSWLPAPPPVHRPADLRVASVLDTMSERCFGAEARLITFRPDNWRQVLEAQRPHLLLVESAWRGGSGSWEYQVGSYSYADSVGLPHLTAVVEWCRSHGVPTVFWNKEDPVHFQKFKEAARLFDVVVTTDADMLEEYRALGGAPRVFGTLPFAAQPSMHNPVAAHDRDPAPVFAGTFYRNRHPERQAQLEMLLDGAMPFGLVIYDRMAGTGSDAFGFPERFRPVVRGRLSYDEMVVTYKRHRVFLNTNSVSGSPTMFSRRVFELLASGTPVVSTPSAGMEAVFGDVVQVVRSAEETREALRRLADDEYWRAVSRAGIRRVHLEHTYAHRLTQLAGLAGIDVTAEARRVAVPLPADDPTAVERLLDMVRHQTSRLHEVVVGYLGAPPADRAVAALREMVGAVRLVAQDPDDAESQGLRALARMTESDWSLVGTGLFRLGRDDLGDLLACTSFTDADVIIPAADPLREHEYACTADADADADVALVRSTVLRERGWPLGETVRMLSEWHAQGVRIYRGPALPELTDRDRRVASPGVHGSEPH